MSNTANQYNLTLEAHTIQIEILLNRIEYLQGYLGRQNNALVEANKLNQDLTEQLKRETKRSNALQNELDAANISNRRLRDAVEYNENALQNRENDIKQAHKDFQLLYTGAGGHYLKEYDKALSDKKIDTPINFLGYLQTLVEDIGYAVEEPTYETLFAEMEAKSDDIESDNDDASFPDPNNPYHLTGNALEDATKERAKY